MPLRGRLGFQSLGIHFYVTDAATGQPIQGALCSVASQANGGGDGDSGLTDATGYAFVNGAFTANWYQVVKDGYVTQSGTYPALVMNIALHPGTTLYGLNIGVMGQGQGSVTATVNGQTVNVVGVNYVPSGAAVVVTPHPQSGSVLRNWVVNEANQNPVNPLTVTMPKNALQIYADFELTPATTYRGIPIYVGASGVFFTYNGVLYNQPTLAEAKTLIDALISSGYPWEKTLHLISNKTLTAGQLATGASMNSPYFFLGDAAKFMGATVTYRITYDDGLGGCSVGVDVNGHNMAQYENIAVGSDISSSFDATSLLYATHNVITVGQSHLPGAFWCHVTYDIIVTLGYSGQPSVEPGVEAGGLSGLAWWQWVLIAGIVVVGVGAVTVKKGGGTAATSASRGRKR